MWNFKLSKKSKKQPSFTTLFIAIIVAFLVFSSLKSCGTLFLITSQVKNDFDFPKYTQLPNLNLHFMIEPSATLCNANKTLMIFTYSKPNDFDYRMAVRSTWGQMDALDKIGANLLFPLGITSNSTIADRILNESAIYGDVILSNFTDSYQNLTYKGIIMLKWLYLRCRSIKYFAKIDSDVFPNLFATRALLDRRSHDERFLMCKVHWHSLVLRPGAWCGKWCVTTHDYSQTHYPPYCWGSFYVISGNLITELYGTYVDTPLWWVADVHLTGHLPLKIEHMAPFKDRIRRVALSQYMETDSEVLFNRLASFPHTTAFGFIKSNGDLFRAWKILSKKYNFE